MIWRVFLNVPYYLFTAEPIAKLLIFQTSQIFEKLNPQSVISYYSMESDQNLTDQQLNKQRTRNRSVFNSEYVEVWLPGMCVTWLTRTNKQIIVLQPRPQVREDRGNEVFKNRAISHPARHPAPHRLWSSTFFVDQRFIACVQTLPPLSKNRFLLTGGGSVHRLTI